MKTLTVGELKSAFSMVLREVAQGTPVAVAFGRTHRKVAVIIPMAQYRTSTPRKLGLLEGRATCRTCRDFKMTDKEVLGT